MPRKSLLSLALAAIPVAGASPLFAQTLPAERLIVAQAQELPVVRVTGQQSAEQERKDVAIQKLVIGSEAIERYGDATVGDVLRRLPGMGFTGPAGVVKDIRIRGLEKGYTQFLINGEPVPSATKERQIQVDRLPADMIERIEIIRSPGATVESSGIGGTINIILKQTADNKSRLRSSYGRNGSLDVGDLAAQWSRRLDNLDIVLGFSHTVAAEDVVEQKEAINAAGVLTEREHKPKPSKKNETLFTPRLTWRNGDDRLTVDSYLSVGSEDKTETSSFTNRAGTYTKGVVKHETKDDTLWRLGARYDTRAAWGNWFAKAGVQQAEIDKPINSIESNALGVVTKRTLEQEDIRDRQHYTGLGLVASPAAGHLVSAGAEWRAAEYDNRKRKTENGVDRTAPADQFKVRENRLLAYLQDEWQIARAHWITPGLRAEHTRREATGATGAPRDNTVTAANPSLHYRWAVSDGLNFRAGWTRNLKLPRFDQINPMVTTRAGTAGDPDNAGNPDLRPERSNGIDLGIERYFGGAGGVFGANVYYRDVQDYIQHNTRLEGGRQVRRPVNLAEAQFWGLELDWRVPLQEKGAHRIDLTGSHAELRGRALDVNRGTYGDIKDMPPRITSVGIDWKHMPSRLSAGVDVNYQPAYTTNGLNDNSEREIKSRNEAALLDFYIQKTLSAATRLRLTAKNVLSLKKREYTTKVNAAGSVTGAEARVEHSRPTVYVTLDLSY